MDKRRRIAEQALLSCGERIQESVFLVVLESRSIKVLRDTIASVIQSEEDAVVWYPICERCQASGDHACGAVAAGLRAGYWIA